MRLSEDPLFATMTGDPRFNDRLPEVSEEAFLHRLEGLRRTNGGPTVSYTLTRAQPPGWTGYARRVDRQMLREVAGTLGESVQAFVCGPTLFVEAVASSLLELGARAEHIRTERFGPTGGSA